MALTGLERASAVLSHRARALAQNLANANTPTYICRDVPFYQIMKATLDKNLTLPLTVQLDYPSSTRSDGNNSSPERELSALLETVLLYRTTLQLAAKEILQLRSAIFKGRRWLNAR